MVQDLRKFTIFWSIPLLLIAIWYLRPIILPFLVGIILGIAIQTFAVYLNFKVKLNFYFNVFIIYVVVILIVSFAFYLTIRVFIDEFPSFLEKLRPYAEIYGLKIKDVKYPEIIKNLNLLGVGSNYFGNIKSFFANFFNWAFSLILIFVVSIYVAFRRNFPEEVFNFFSSERSEDYTKIWRKIKRKISFWLMGQLFLGVVIGVLTYIFMGPIFKIGYAPMIALFSGLLELVPIIGPLISLILALIITFLDKPEMIFFVAAFFIVLQQLENHLLVPMVMKKAISFHPLLIIFGVLVGGKMGGVLGIIVILPLLGVVVEIINYLQMRGGVMGSTFPSGGKDSGSSPDPAASRK